jgi:hypothetical protein
MDSRSAIQVCIYIGDLVAAGHPEARDLDGIFIISVNGLRTSMAPR